MTQANTTIRVEGMTELEASFDTVIRNFSTRDIKKVLTRAAKPLRAKARSLAPIGPTGNLRKSIKTKPLRGQAVAVGAQFNIAPHAHLVIRGTDERFRKRGIFRVGRVDFGLIKGSTGEMPDNPFMADAERATIGQVHRIIVQGFKQLLDDAGR